MSSHVPDVPPEQPGPPSRPSLSRELWTLSKVILGVAFIAFGCWRIWMIAFGPDESLLFGYRVRTTSATKQAQILREQGLALRELTRTVPDPKQRADRAAEITKNMEARIVEQADIDRRGYRTQRWMELFVVAFLFYTAPGLVTAGKGILWGLKNKQNQPPE